MMLCVLSSCCMYVCVCVFDFGYHYALLYISGLLRRTSDIFRYLKLLRTRSACQANPERESVWSNSNTDAAAVDLSIFVSLVFLLWALLRSSFFMFFNGSSRWRSFKKLRHRHSPPPCYRSAEMFKTLPFFSIWKPLNFTLHRKTQQKQWEEKV